MYYIRLLFFLFFLSFSASGQHRIGLYVGYHKLGLVQGVEYAYSKKRGGVFLEGDAHSIRLFQQKKIQFRLTGGGSYALIKKEQIRLKALLSYGLSHLAITLKQRYFWDEILVGTSVELGKKWQFVFQGKVGWIQQRFKSVVSNQWIRAQGLGYSIKLGVQYEI